MKKVLALILALVMIFALAACGQAKPASSDKLVGVAMPTKDLQRWNQDGEYMKEKLEAAGYDVDLQFGANDVQTQVSQLENMIANGAKVLVIASIDGSSLGTVLAQAKEKQIPVIAYDRLIMDSDAVSYYATFDNWLVGTTQGEFIEQALGLKDGKGPYNIEFITGSPDDNNINYFFDGAISVLKPYMENGQLVCPSGQTEKLDVATPGWDTAKAQERFENILSSFYGDGTQLDVVLASNDSTARGVENALESSYTGAWPVITGQDCDIAIMKNLIEGKQSMSVFKDTRTLAAKVVEMVDALMKGSEPPVNDTETYNNGVKVVPSFLCGPVACTAENYKEILIDSGYYTLEQLGVDGEAAPAAAEPAPAAEPIKVGVVNNPPSESGYREANVNDFISVFTADNGYDAKFFYSIKNDEQLSAARQFITDGVDYLLISAAETTGWDAVLKDAKDAGIGVFFFDRMIDCDTELYEAAVVSNMANEGDTAVAWLLDQGLDEYNVIHIQGAMGSDAQIGRTGALDAAAAEGKVKLVVQQTATWDEAEAKKITESVINSGEAFNVIYAENDGMAKGAVAALDEAGITHGVDKDVIVMGFDCNKWALRELLAGNWNYDGQCSPFQAAVIDEMIKTLEAGGTIDGLNELKQKISVEKGFDARELTQADIDTYGLGE
ncbi:MAG: substrate-binding domain-containing protein [Oscillospiraceae bacterium]|nr:substrate-binding domain-containing protein [Oscillospiraceae bacterium]